MSKPSQTPPSNAPEDPRLRDLRQRLEDVRETPGNGAPGSDKDANEAMSAGWRLSMELVLAPLVGAGMGWLIDKGLGTRPWGLLIFLGFGAVAGFLNVMRTARQLNAADGKK